MLGNALKIRPAALVNKLPGNKLVIMSMASSVVCPMDGGLVEIKSNRHGKVATDGGMPNNFGP